MIDFEMQMTNNAPLFTMPPGYYALYNGIPFPLFFPPRHE